MLPEAHLVHDAHGRTRLRIPSKRRDAKFFVQVTECFKELEGMERLETNPSTASLLLVHSTSAKAIAAFAEAEALFAVPPSELEARTVLKKVAKAVDSIDSKLQKATEKKVDLASASFLGLVGLGIYQLFQGNALAPASTLFTDAVKCLSANRRDMVS